MDPFNVDKGFAPSKMLRPGVGSQGYTYLDMWTQALARDNHSSLS